jgi:DNA-binding CsgD family transcriptional regulator
MNQYNNLTQTQKSIVDLFLNGYLSSKGISQKLNISPSTVDNHFDIIKKSLQVNTKSELFRLLIKDRKIMLLATINQIKIILEQLDKSNIF